MDELPEAKHRENIGYDEEDLILKLHALLGNRWSLIAGRLPGRTDNEIKNYWNTHLSKKLKSKGIDPNTHKPILSLSPQPTNCHSHIHSLTLPEEESSKASRIASENRKSGRRMNESFNTDHIKHFSTLISSTVQEMEMKTPDNGHDAYGTQTNFVGGLKVLSGSSWEGQPLAAPSTSVKGNKVEVGCSCELPPQPHSSFSDLFTDFLLFDSGGNEPKEHSKAVSAAATADMEPTSAVNRR